MARTENCRTENSRLENCPLPDELARAVLGLLPSADLTPIEAHLLECETCLAWLDTHPVSDPLVEAMRQASQVEASWAASWAQEAPASEDLVAWARQAVLQPRPQSANLDTEPTTAHQTPPPGAPDDVGQAFQPDVRALNVGAVALQRATNQSDAASDSQLDPSQTYDFLSPPQAPGELGRLGPYRVLRLLGEGGMGVVFEAEDVHLKRRVALKAMKPAIAASASARKRFLREAQAAASVEHDHIVAIYQVGDERAIPFIAMPLLRGETLAERLNRLQVTGDRLQGREQVTGNRLQEEPANADVAAAQVKQDANAQRLTPNAQRLTLPLPEMLRITREIAAGLEAAHERGLIHRDVKPANIWLEEKTGRVKLLDFGLARAADSAEQLTQAGAVMGTPSYMAPEQARGDEVDARADLFSLGCVAYHMATGQRPFAGRDSLATALAVTTQHPAPPRELNPELPDDVAALIVQLLEKEPALRVQTARDVVDRVRALEGRERVTGYREQGTAGRASRPAAQVPRREPPVCDAHAVAMAEKAPTHRGQEAGYGDAFLGAGWPTRRIGAVALAAAAAFALLAGVVIIIRDSSGKKVAEIVTDSGATVKPANGATIEIRPTTPGPKNDDTPQDNATDSASAAKSAADESNSAEPADEKNRGLTPGHLRSGSARLRESTAPLSTMAVVTRPAELKGVEIWTLETVTHRGPIYQAEYAPDGQLLATLGADGTLRLWNAITGKLLRCLVGHGPDEGCFCWSSDGTRLAVSDRDAITIWEVATGKRLRAAKIDDALRAWAVAWSPNGRTLAMVVSRRGATGTDIELYDAESGELLDSHRSYLNFDAGSALQRLAWSPDSGKLAITNGGGTLIWNVSAGKPVQSFAKTLIRGITWTTDSRLLAAVQNKPGHVELWDVDANELLQTLSRDHDELRFSGFSAGGKTLVAAHFSDSARTEVSTWNVTTGAALREWQFLGPFEDVILFAIGAGDDPQVVEFSSMTGELRALPGAVQDSAWRQAALQPNAWYVNTIGPSAWAPDAQSLAIRTGENSVILWDMIRCTPRAICTPPTWTITSLAWANGTTALHAWNHVQSTLYDGITGQHLSNASVDIGPASFKSLSTDGALVALADGKHVHIHETDSGKRLRTLDAETKFPPTWSHDGKGLATVADETTLWDIASGKPLHTLPFAGRCQWSPDSSRLAYTYGNGELFEIRDAEQGALVARLDNDEPVVVEGLRLAWSHDGKRIAGFGRIWDASDGKVLHPLDRPGTAPSSFPPVWSPDDRFVTYPTPDSATAITDAATGHVAVTLLSFSRNRSLAVSAEGHYRASPRTDEELVYIVQNDDGQETLSPREFEEKYGWKNDPAQVALASVASGGRKPPGDPPNDVADAADEAIQNPKSKIQNRPLGRLALVQRPPELTNHPEVLGWSIEPLAPIAMHQNRHGMLALRPDGKLLAIAGCDGHIRVFDWQTGKLVKLLIGHASPVQCVDWSRDGKFLGSADRDRGQVCVWEAGTGRLVSSALVGMNVACLQWSPDGGALAAGGDGGVRFVEPSSGELLPGITPRGFMGSLAWSPDSKRLAGGSGDYGGAVAWIWNAAGGELEHTLACPNAGQGGLVAWSPDGKSLVVVPMAGDQVSVWNTADGTLRKSLDVPGLWCPVPVWLDEGMTIAGLCSYRPGKAGCQRLNVETGTLIDDPWLENRGESALCVAADRLVTASSNVYGDPIVVYDSVSRKRRTIEFSSGACSAGLSPDGRNLAVGCFSGDAWVCGESHRGTLQRLQGLGNAAVVRWLPDGESLLSTTRNVSSRVLSAKGNGWAERPIGILPWQPSTISVTADGAQVAFVRHGSDLKKVEIWDLNTGTHLRDIEPDLERIWSIAYSPQGDRMAIGLSTGSPGVGGIYDAITGKKLHDFAPSISGAHRLAWSPDGSRIAAACADGAVRFCDAAGTVVAEFPGAGVEHRCPLLAWSVDGTVLWAADGRRTRSWRAADGALQTERSNSAPFIDLTQWMMSADSRRIVAPSGAVRISDSATGDLQAAFVPLRHEQAVAISPDGHWRGTVRAEQEIVYVVKTTEGQQVLSPKEFAKQYGWKNDPERVTLGGAEGK